MVPVEKALQLFGVFVKIANLRFGNLTDERKNGLHLGSIFGRFLRQQWEAINHFYKNDPERPNL